MRRDRFGNPRVRAPSDLPPVALIWRGDGVAAVDKPSGMLCHNSAFAGGREWTLVQAAPPLLGYSPRLLHRLDRGTSGLLLVAAPSADAAAWQAAISDGTKSYLGLVRGWPRQAIEIDHPVRDEGGRRLEARTTLVPLAHSRVDRCSLVRLTLHSGRWRQARQHCKHVSHPLLGDGDLGKGPLNRQYAADYGLERLALHAWRLELVVPGSGLPLALVCPLPGDLLGPWSRLFDDALLGELQSGVGIGEGGGRGGAVG